MRRNKLLPVLELCSTSPIRLTHAARTTPSGTHAAPPHSRADVPRSLPVADFKPRKDQRKAVNAWNRFVLGDAYPTDLAILHPKSKQEKAEQRDFDLVRAVHEAEAGHVRRPPEPAHRFEVTLDRDDFTEEKYAVYLEYQMAIHHETAAKNSRPQVPALPVPLAAGAARPDRRGEDAAAGAPSTSATGSTAVARRLRRVLDLLPHCVSGVYFVYHPDFSPLRAWARSARCARAALAREGGYGYYYMGYYIHSCPKMQYKNDDYGAAGSSSTSRAWDGCRWMWRRKAHGREITS